MIYSVEGLSFAYAKGAKNVLQEVSFTLAEGEILTVLGPNGVGKSTLLHCLAGLFATQGAVRLCGKPLEKMSEKERARIVSLVQQKEQSSFPYTVKSFVTMGRAPLLSTFEQPKEADRAAVRQAMEQLGIAHLEERACTQISGGEYQQAMIARAIVRAPKVILFDEPTAHLDYANQMRVLRLIKTLSEQGYAIIVTTHDPGHPFLLGGSAALLEKGGTLQKGAVEEIVTQEALERVYGAKLLLHYMEEVERTVCIYPKL